MNDLLHTVKKLSISKIILSLQLFSFLCWFITYLFFREISEGVFDVAFLGNIACFMSAVVFVLKDRNKASLVLLGKSFLLFLISFIITVLFALGCGYPGLG